METNVNNQAILDQILQIAKQVFTENEELFKPYGVAFTLTQVMKNIETINKHAWNKPYSDKTEVTIENGSFRCSFLRENVFYILQKFAKLPGCKLDSKFLFTISDTESRIEKIKVYDTKKDGTIKQKTVLVEFLSNNFAFETGKGDYANMYYIIDNIGYPQGENYKDIAQQRAKKVGKDHNFAICSIQNLIDKNEYIGTLLYMLAVVLGFDKSILDANNDLFNQKKAEKERTYQERLQKQQRKEQEERETRNAELIAEKLRKIESLKRNFLNGKYISVDTFRNLCSECNIDIAPRTIGLLKNRIADISINGVRYYSTCKRKPNLDTLYDIIATLKDFLSEEEQIGENPELYMTDSECEQLFNGTLSETFATETDPAQNDTYIQEANITDIPDQSDETESINITQSETVITEISCQILPIRRNKKIPIIFNLLKYAVGLIPYILPKIFVLAFVLSFVLPDKPDIPIMGYTGSFRSIPLRLYSNKYANYSANRYIIVSNINDIYYIDTS